LRHRDCGRERHLRRGGVRVIEAVLRSHGVAFPEAGIPRFRTPLWSCRALRSHSKTATPWRTQPSREHTEANVRAQGAPVLPHLNRRRRDGGGRFASVAAGSARHSVPARGRACAPAGHEGGTAKRESLVGWPPGWKPAASSFTATGGKIVVVAAQERAPS